MYIIDTLLASVVLVFQTFEKLEPKSYFLDKIAVKNKKKYFQHQ